MLYEIQKSISYDIIPCECGAYPNFMIIEHHTDCWLQCPVCGAKTKNTGGYHYAMEIPLIDAKVAAIKLWNDRVIYKG